MLCMPLLDRASLKCEMPACTACPTELIDPIRPVVRMVAAQPGDKLTNVINANVKEGVKRLRGLDPTLSKPVNSGELLVVGGVYQLRTGKVELLD
jgi:carbonic anhydrase